MRVARLTVVAATLMALASASLHAAHNHLGAKPLDNACVSWIESSSSTKTDVSNLIVAAQAYVLFDASGTCEKKGDVIPCFATNASTFGHHDYVSGYLPFDYCRVAQNGDFVGANNFYLPSQGASFSSFKWVTVATGGAVPDNAIRYGNTVLARSAANAPGNCAGQGYTGWIDAPADATFGRLHFVIESQTFSVSSFDVAICDIHTPAPPTPPPTLPPNNKPYIRFGDTIPYAHNVDVVITQKNITYTWTNYAFGQFSDWVEVFADGFGEIYVYENNFGKRGALQLKREIPLTPGPLVVVTRGAWPPTHYNSVETIAASYIPVNSGSGVRLFNLSPDTQQATLTDTTTGSTLATNVDYSLGSGWAPVASTSASFAVSDSKSGTSLASITYTPPNAPFVFTVFLIGLQNATGTTFAPTLVALVDAPES